ncbi:MAG: sigma-54-dependent Fis family transcriptional regulator [Kiritimatiellae bacterium]|nr:sigma-54-dependent Fis family transcriptional regulator [Kiritimatiellia bacterium]
MNGSDNLILTGWGHVEYVAAAAAALKALEKDADVLGVSRRRLPELMEEIAERREGREASARRPKRIYIVGVSVSGDPARLAAALRRLKARGVKTTWISALEMPEEASPALAGLMEAKVYDASLLEAVGQALAVDVEEFVPFLKSEKKSTADIRAYIAFIQAAQFYYRNYQDESLYAKAVRYIATGVKPAAWDAETKEAVAHYDRYGGRELIGKSPVMATLQERINRVAKCDRARVLILGESGTGKETVANQIHNKSPRAKMPFVPFNCASVTKDLLEDRFFGHERGAFTNAVERTDGLFLQADGGTLFLDEIGEMPIEVQALLLRVLEGGRFMRVGGREELKCDVRLVTATNRDLPKLVAEGKFREDLYQRLNVVQLRTPSLREHKEDIPLIANSWWRKFHDNRVLDEVQLAALMDYDYPGNVRELVNLLDRATALGEDDFAALMREHKEMNAGLLGGLELKSGRIPDRLEDATKMHVRRVFEKYGQNLTRAAEALGVSRNTVRKYL